MATVEVDIGSIPDSGTTVDDLLADGFTPYAKKNPTVTATLYYYYTTSINFGESTDSVFIGLAGPEKCLKQILGAMQRSPGVRARYSEYISPYSAAPMIHIEAGKVFRAEDPLNWYTVDGESDATDSSVQDTDTGFQVNTEHDPGAEGGGRDNSRGPVPSEYRSARADASVGSIRKTMEEIFGLPDGSVALCGPDGKPLRATAKIATLRKRWE